VICLLQWLVEWKNLSSGGEKKLLSADISTARHQHEAEACTVCGISGTAEKITEL
jgi:hypothetical protein